MCKLYGEWKRVEKPAFVPVSYDGSNDEDEMVLINNDSINDDYN